MVFYCSWPMGDISYYLNLDNSKSLFITTEGTETTEKCFLLQAVTSVISVCSVVNL